MPRCARFEQHWFFFMRRHLNRHEKVHCASYRVAKCLRLQCLEWLPMAGLTELYLHQDGGRPLPARTEVPAAPIGGTIAGIVTWKLERRGILWFHPSRPRWRGDSANWLGGFITVLITNFPELLVRIFEIEEVRVVATPVDHPITALVTSSSELTILLLGARDQLEWPA